MPESGKWDARTDGDLAGHLVDFLDRLEPAKTEHHFVLKWNTTTDQPGISALWDQRNAKVTAGSNDACDLFGCARAHHRRRVTCEATGPVGHRGADDLRIRSHMVADDLA